MATPLHLGITGMSCAGCAANVERALARLPGARDVSVNFALATADLTLEAPAADAVEAVRGAGYDVALATVSLEIGGMSCAGCAAAVEKALKAAPGVVDARVNLALNSAEVDVADAEPRALVAAVEAAGYTARVPLADGTPAPAEAPDRSGRTLLAAALLSAPFLANMAAMLTGAPPLLPPWAEWALATPVWLLCGWRFHRGAVKALGHGAANMDVLVSLGTSVAYLFSVWMVLDAPPGAHPHLYFEAAALIVTLVLFGKWLEARAKKVPVSILSRKSRRT
ncbi:Copper-exporting P-type ATPase A (fragment) [uncultured Alphaproteobacteria bacterium]|uniref:Copper-exporting P-type ATPase A n=1 Tax=uncultured Alphaproteobacteria bacterium TaxID=91750 RepID=A0A212JXL6_9PROT